MNKKGSPAILVFVIFAIAALAAIVVSVMFNSSNIDSSFEDVASLDSLVLIKNFGEFYILDSMENSLSNEYYNFVTDSQSVNFYMKNPVKNSEGYFLFNQLHDNLDSNFRGNLILEFKDNFLSYDFERDSLNDLKISIRDLKDKYIVYDGNDFSVNVSNWEIIVDGEELDAFYAPKISLSISFDEIGLNSFEDIYSAKEACKSDTDIQRCMQGYLNNFDVGISLSADGSYKIVTLTSKKYFFIGDEYKKISFSFVPA